MYGVKNSSRNQNDFNIDFKHEADQTPTNEPPGIGHENDSSQFQDDDGNSVFLFLLVDQ